MIAQEPSCVHARIEATLGEDGVVRYYCPDCDRTFVAADADDYYGGDPG